MSIKQILTFFSTFLMMGLVYFETSLGYYFVSTVKLFSTGLSLFKVYFFLGFIWVPCVWKVHLTEEQLKKKFLLCFYLLVSLFGLSLFSHILTLFELGLNLGDSLSYVSGGVSTYSDLYHLHEGKGAIAFLFSPFLKSFSFDYGGGLLSHLIWPVALVQFIFFGILGFEIMRLLCSEKLKEKVYYPILFISFHCLLRTTLDGGLFDRTSVIYQTVFLLVFLKTLGKKYWGLTLFYPLFLWGIYYLLTGEIYPKLKYFTPYFLMMIGIGTLACFFYKGVLAGKREIMAGAFLGLCLGVYWFFPKPYFSSMLAMSQDDYYTIPRIGLGIKDYEKKKVQEFSKKNFYRRVSLKCRKELWRKVDERAVLNQEHHRGKIYLKTQDFDLTIDLKHGLYVHGKIKNCLPRTSDWLNAYLYKKLGQDFIWIRSDLRYQ